MSTAVATDAPTGFSGYVEVESHPDERGALYLPPVPDGFDVRHHFYVTGADGIRGDHAHREATQVIWCMQGMVKMVSQGRGVCNVCTLIPSHAVVIPPKTWVTLCGFTDDCVYTVWSDREYDESEYIRDPEEFSRIAGQWPRPVLFVEGQVYLGDASWTQ